MKTVHINETLHEKIKHECKGKKPKTNLADRIEDLIQKGLRFEAMATAK